MEQRMNDVEALDRLGQEVVRRGYLVLHDVSGGRPRLEVVNRASSARVLCECGWFWWAWAERICPADDLDSAAAIVDSALC